jgi:hypothetical protein
MWAEQSKPAPLEKEGCGTQNPLRVAAHEIVFALSYEFLVWRGGFSWAPRWWVPRVPVVRRTG